MGRRKNPTPPPDFDDAIEGYTRFSEFEPREVGLLDGLVIPTHLYDVGKALRVFYRSDKWEAKNHDYVHDHGGGVRVYMPDVKHLGADMEDVNKVAVPPFLRNVQTIYLLGICLGFHFDLKRSKTIEAEVIKPYPELYAAPSGQALLVVETHGRKAKILAAMWGGGLDVRAEGIVG